VAVRVLLALEWRTHDLGASDEAIGHRFRPDFAVLYACGLQDSQRHPSQAPFGWPETLCELRGRLDATLLDELSALHAAAAMEAGLVTPAPLVLDPFPSAQGRQRVTAATTL
jgi:hypothetical protein